MKEKTFSVGIGNDDKYEQGNRTIADRVNNTVINGLYKLLDEEIDEASGGNLYHGDSLKFEIKITYEPEDK